MSQLDEKLEVVDGVEYRYSTDWIHGLESEEHWRLYWRQQHIMDGIVQSGDHVLEIGVGTGFTANYLQSKGIAVTTLDIDEGKKPDIIANIVQYDFPDEYDAILAFEIFEHIPLHEFEKLLGRLISSCGHLFFSVPRSRKVAFRLACKLPKLKLWSVEWKVKRGRMMEGYHHWEIDYEGMTIESLETMLSSAGFVVRRREEAFDRLFYAAQRSHDPGKLRHRDSSMKVSG